MSQPVHTLRSLLPACLCATALAPAALAQSINVTLNDPPTDPAQRTEDGAVSASVHVVGCSEIPIGVERIGQLITLRYVNDNCPVIPIPSERLVPLGVLPVGTYILRVLEVSDPQAPRTDDEAIFTVGEALCPPPPVTPPTPQLCLRAGRFSVIANWTYNPGPISGFGRPFKLSSDSGAFWFFTDSNYELMVKLLDGCSLNGRYWFFAAGLTDVKVDVIVRDNLTGQQKQYINPIGRPVQPITDTSAFACQ